MFNMFNYEAQRYCMDMGHEYRDHVCVRCNDHDSGYKADQCDHDWYYHEVKGPGIMPGYPETTRRTKCGKCGKVYDPDDVDGEPPTTTGWLNSDESEGQ